jgi:predicted dienelactone hydrolase
MKAVTLAAALLSAAAAANAADVGYDRMDVTAAHRAAPVAASVWYPAGARTYRGLIGDNAVFRGAPAFVGAAVAEGRFPLVLLSHGSGGNMDNLGWLSAALAAEGVMVLAVNHPGSTSGDSSPRRSADLAARAADLSAALDALLADPAFGPRVDASRITTLGFSLGGATALALGGLRFDPAAYPAYCARLGAAAVDCAFFAKGGVAPNSMPASWNSDMADPRVTAVIAADPGFTFTATPGSAAAMNLPVLLVSLGAEDLFPAADVSAAGSSLAEALPDARHAVIAPAHHFSFLGLCKPEGAAILREEEDDPVCDEPAGGDRAAVHAAVVAEALAFLRR